MNSLLLVIDLQFAFINENTSFLPQKIQELINSNKYNKVVFTRFVNSKNSIYTDKLNYYACIGEDKEIVLDVKNKKILDKKVYSAVNEELEEYIANNNIDKIYVCGIDTECCVLKTCLDLFEKEYNVFVLKDYCACTHGVKSHNNAIQILKRCMGKEYVI